MSYLLDSHVWLWLLYAAARFSPKMSMELNDPANSVYVSTASLWEVAVKYRSGRLALRDSPVRLWNTGIRSQGLIPLNIAASHALAAAELPMHHRDPFDRVIVAQAKLLNLTLVTADRKLQAYAVAQCSP